MTSTIRTEAAPLQLEDQEASWRPSKKTVAMITKAGLCYGATLSVPWIPVSPPLAGGILGFFAFLSFENVFHDYHPRKGVQLAVGSAISAAGNAISFMYKGDLKLAWASWGAGVVVAHLDPLWKRCCKMKNG